MGDGDSMGWGVDSDVGARVDSADGIKFGIYNDFNLGSSDYYFDYLNNGNHVRSLLQN